MVVDARRPVHRHRAHARSGAHRRPLRRRRRAYAVKALSERRSDPVRAVARHPRFDLANYLASRATADLALIKLAAPLPDMIVPAALAAPRRVKVGETLTIAGFGTVAAAQRRGLGDAAHGEAHRHRQPGSLQIRLYDRPRATPRRPRRLHRRFRRARLRRRRPAGDRRGELDDRRQDEEGCGGLTGLTPLLLYRAWIVDTARKFNSPLAP